MPFKYDHLNNTTDFRDTYDTTKAINVYIIHNTRSILHVKYTQVMLNPSYVPPANWWLRNSAVLLLYRQLLFLFVFPLLIPQIWLISIVRFCNTSRYNLIQ
jgi:hypothetical protein